MNVLLCTVEYSTSILNTIFYYSTGTFSVGQKGLQMSRSHAAAERRIITA